MALFSALTKMAACSIKGLNEAREGDIISNETAAEIVGSADDVIEEVLTAVEQNTPVIDLRAIYRPVPQPVEASDVAIMELRFLINNQFAIFDHDVDDPIRLEVRKLALQLICPAPVEDESEMSKTVDAVTQDTAEQEHEQNQVPMVDLADADESPVVNATIVTAQDNDVDVKTGLFSGMLTVTKVKPSATGGRSRSAPPKPQAATKKPRAPRTKKTHAPATTGALDTSSATDDNSNAEV